MDLRWLVMAVLNSESRRSCLLRYFYAYRPSTTSAPKSSNPGARRSRSRPAEARRNSATQFSCPNAVARIARLCAKHGRPTRDFQAAQDFQARSARALGALGVDIKGASLAFDDLRTDHHLFDTVESRQFKHRVEQNALHDRAQAAGPGAPLDRLLGHDAQRLLLDREVGVLHLE